MKAGATLSLESQERLLLWSVAVRPQSDDFLAVTQTPDSTLRFYLVGPRAPRKLVATIAGDDTLRPAFRRGPSLTGDGRYADFWLKRDTLFRIPLRSRDATPSIIARQAPNFLQHRDASGRALVWNSIRSTEVWRFAVPPDTGFPPTRVDHTVGDVGESAYSPDGKVIARIGPGLFVQSVDGGATRVLLRSRGSLTGVRWSPDGLRLAVRETVNTRIRWVVVDVRDGSVVNLGYSKYRIPKGSYPSAWSPDGRHLFVSSMDDAHPEIVRHEIVEGDSGTVVFASQASDGALDGIAVRPDGRALAVGGSSVKVVPLDGGAARTVTRDVSLHMLPIRYRSDGEITVAAIPLNSSYIRFGLRELFVIGEHGGPPHHRTVLPVACRFHIGLLHEEREATCFQSEQVTEWRLMEGTNR